MVIPIETILEMDRFWPLVDVQCKGPCYTEVLWLEAPESMNHIGEDEDDKAERAKWENQPKIPMNEKQRP